MENEEAGPIFWIPCLSDDCWSILSNLAFEPFCVSWEKAVAVNSAKIQRPACLKKSLIKSAAKLPSS